MDERIREHEKRELWFTDLWNNLGLHEIRWTEIFKTTRPTFGYIVHLVRPFIAKKDTRSRKAISVEESVAVTLSRLFTENSYISI